MHPIKGMVTLYNTSFNKSDVKFLVSTFENNSISSLSTLNYSIIFFSLFYST